MTRRLVYGIIVKRFSAYAILSLLLGVFAIGAATQASATIVNVTYQVLVNWGFK